MDRRPRCWTSNIPDPSSSDPLHLSRDPHYLIGGLSALLTGMKEKMDRGFPFPVIHMLPGNPVGQLEYTSAFWGLLSDADKAALSALPSWLTEIDFYAGFRLSSPTAFFLSNPRNPDHSLLADRNHWNASWTPLINVLALQGITFNTLWLDAASAFPTALATLGTQIRLPRLGGEALPCTDVGAGGGPGGRVYNLNTTALRQRPWACTYKFFKSFSTAAPIPWAVSPSTTEAHVVVQFDDLPNEAALTALVTAGFIIDSWGGVDANTDALILSLQGY